MDRVRKSWWYILVAVVVLAGVGYWFLATVRASYFYSVAAEFAALPADDGRLEEWLRAQPGVVADTVHVERGGAKDTGLKVMFIQSRNMWGRPAFPDLDRAGRELGYERAVAAFRDVR